jgi:hypothetical protein
MAPVQLMAPHTSPLYRCRLEHGRLLSAGGNGRSMLHGWPKVVLPGDELRSKVFCRDRYWSGPSGRSAVPLVLKAGELGNPLLAKPGQEGYTDIRTRLSRWSHAQAGLLGEVGQAMNRTVATTEVTRLLAWDAASGRVISAEAAVLLTADGKVC